MSLDVQPASHIPANVRLPAVGRWPARVLVALLPLLAAGAVVRADSVKGVVSRESQPVAVSGGVLMLPLTAERPGDDWPDEIQLAFADGSKTRGIVAWIDAAPPRTLRHWTDDPRGLFVRAVGKEDDSRHADPATGIGPWLLAELPAGKAATGEIRMGRQVLKPTWRELPPITNATETDGESDERPALELAPGYDRPDPASPFEYWRWVLLAQRLDMRPPQPFGGQLDQLVARHDSDMWRLGLSRIRPLSQRIADECRDLLTRTCIDRRQPFAAWISDPASTGSLLAALTDFNRSDKNALAAAVAWIDSQPPLYVWPEAESPGQVHLAVFSSRQEATLAKIHWRGEPADRFLAVPCAPGVLARVNIDRPALPAIERPRAIGRPAPEAPFTDQTTLEVEAGGRKFEFTFGPRILNAVPPGVFFRQLSPPITLYEAQERVQQRTDPAHATFASLRKLGGRWEVFFDCRRPGAPPDSAAPLPEHLNMLDDTRGVEAVTLMIGAGDDDDPSAIWLTIPENGFQNLARGPSDGMLQIHKRSFSDRWHCRVVLPDGWVPIDEPTPLLLGFARSHFDSDQLESGPAICTPWTPKTGRAAARLNDWNDPPKPEPEQH